MSTQQSMGDAGERGDPDTAIFTEVDRILADWSTGGGLRGEPAGHVRKSSR